MKKEWINPELREAKLSTTQDETIPCPEEEVSAIATLDKKPKCAVVGCQHKVMKGDKNSYSQYCKCHSKYDPNGGGTGTEELEDLLS